MPTLLVLRREGWRRTDSTEYLLLNIGKEPLVDDTFRLTIILATVSLYFCLRPGNRPRLLRPIIAYALGLAAGAYTRARTDPARDARIRSPTFVEPYRPSIGKGPVSDDTFRLTIILPVLRSSFVRSLAVTYASPRKRPARERAPFQYWNGSGCR